MTRDRERATRGRDPFLHAQPPEIRAHVWRQPAAIVFDGEHDGAGAHLKGGADPGGARVANGIGQRLLHHAIDHHFDVGRERGRTVDREIDLQS